MSGNWLRYAAFGSIALALILGIIAYRWTAALSREKAAQARPVEVVASSTLAVMALRPISANVAIGPDDVALMPISVVPKNYYTQIEDALGKIPQLDIDAGAPVTPRYFISANPLARIIPEQHKAVSLEISDVVAVGGFVRPGDEVDLLLYVRTAGLPAQARILLKQALVLAYEERIISLPAGSETQPAAAQRRTRARTAVVAVPDELTTKVMLGASLGEIRLALHRRAPEDSGSGALPPSEEALAAERELARSEKVITVEELTRIKEKKKPAARPPAHRIYVYRGTEVERVND